jgi:hypothetical protein
MKQEKVVTLIQYVFARQLTRAAVFVTNIRHCIQVAAKENYTEYTLYTSRPTFASKLM